MSNQISNIVTSSHIIGINDETTCNARDLHTGLDVSLDFLTWIRSRVDEYGFTDGFDFILVNGEYHLTSDMAKELAMIENTPMGKMVRHGFIAAERELRQFQKSSVQRLQDKVAQLGSDDYTNKLEVVTTALDDRTREWNLTKQHNVVLEEEVAMFRGRGRKDAMFKRLLEMEARVRMLEAKVWDLGGQP